MKKGWLIVNEYLDTKKFKEIQELFLIASKDKDTELSVHTNAEFVVDLCTGKVLSKAFNEGKPDYIIFYDKDITLANALEDMDLLLFNCSDSVEICDSKVQTAKCIEAYNNCPDEYKYKEDMKYIRMPKTIKVPFSYENIGILRRHYFDYMELVEKELMADGKKTAYPLIIKESNSSFGMGVHLANNREEAISLICEYGNKECLIQEYIETSSGRDVRLQMVSDNCVAAMMRSNDNDFRANVSNGGQMSKYVPTDEDISLARAVMTSLGLDFAGIDIMHDKLGKPIFCEANSNAHFKNLYDLTGINVAESMIDYILDFIGND